MTITQETLSWPFKDAEWKNKFLIGSALYLAGTLIPIIGWLGLIFVNGYILVIMRGVMRGESPALPKWDKFGELFVDGLKGALSAFAYLVPGILSLCCGYVFIFALIFGGSALTPSLDRAAGAGFGIAFILMELGFFVTIGIAMTLFFLGIVPMPVATAQYARTGEIGAGYRVREVWQIFRANKAGYFIAWTIIAGISFITSLTIYFGYATIILCFALPILWAPIHFYSALIYATLFGMAYREGIEKTDLATAA